MIIETARLLMREFVADDWQAVLAYQADPRYMRFYDMDERTEADVRKFVQMFLDQQAESPRQRFQLAVTLKESGVLIGNCGIRVNNVEWREANIGYEIAPELWGRGYASEAARAILTFGFAQLAMHRIWAWCVADNAGSARVLEKLGMTLEAREREKELIRGQWYDSLTYAILEREYAEDDRMTTRS
ncbi:MAG: GNAT family N-acetyltransferase [Chloroflexi bacterium]|nr:GNAT family N-acetyltransferase [Chloroflexota bacterium]